ncbi:MAG: ThuA domain-containing protein [Acidobacteriota bacterium]
MPLASSIPTQADRERMCAGGGLRRGRMLSLAAVVAVALLAPTLTLMPNSPKRKLLYLTHSAGFKHSVLPLSEQIVKEIGVRSGAFEATSTQDCSLINADHLKNYDALVFYTTGELPFSEAQKQAFLDFIKSGKGFVGVHSATDTFYQWPEYGQIIGGYFDQHPWHEDVNIEVLDPKHPAVRHLAPSFEIKDEIYQFKDFLKDKLHVLLKLDNRSVDLNAKNVKRPDQYFALSWTNQYGKGRIFYTALGHRDEVWQDSRFQEHLLNGIRWTTRDVK